MAAMQVVQPKVKQLQNRYKGKTSREDKQKMQQELMQLYKEHNVNPFGSCLPMVVQIPVFLSLYFVLKNFTGDHARDIFFDEFRFFGTDLGDVEADEFLAGVTHGAAEVGIGVADVSF